MRANARCHFWPFFIVKKAIFNRPLVWQFCSRSLQCCNGFSWCCCSSWLRRQLLLCSQGNLNYQSHSTNQFSLYLRIGIANLPLRLRICEKGTDCSWIIQVEPFGGSCTQFTSIFTNTLGKARADGDTPTVSSLAAIFGRAVTKFERSNCLLLYFHGNEVLSI